MQPEVFFLTFQVGLKITERLHLEHQRQKTVAREGVQVHVKLLAIAGKGAHGVEHLALGLGQPIQPDPATRAAQQWLRQGSGDGRVGHQLVHAGKSEHEAVGDIGGELTARGQVAGEAQGRGGRQSIILGGTGAELLQERVVGAVPVHAEFELVQRQVQSGNVERLQGRLIFPAIQHRHLDGPILGQLQLSLLGQRQELSPGGRFDEGSLSVLEIVTRSAELAGMFHKIVGGGVVGRHGRTVGVERIEQARTRWRHNRQVGRGPVFLVAPLGQKVVGIAVGLLPVVSPAATDDPDQQEQREQATAHKIFQPARKAGHDTGAQ